MSLEIVPNYYDNYGVDPCWDGIKERFLAEEPELSAKNIRVCINTIQVSRDKKNIIWLHESPSLPDVKKIINKITTDPSFFEQHSITVYSCIQELHKYPFVKKVHPSLGAWVKPEYMPSKTKMVSMISSLKGTTRGHKLRISVMKSLPSCVTLYGREVNPIKEKADGLRDYCFSIAIENDDTNFWFTEKLIDCFLTCTVPIYWGCPAVLKIFDPRGIIFLDKPVDYCSLTHEQYRSMLPAIEANYYLALKHNIQPIDTLRKIVSQN